MKKLITLALIIGTTTLTNAQSNLVFNQALIVKLTSSTEQIVPEGKVWKVESMSEAGGNILVNDSEWAIGVNGSFRNMPAWFPAGTSLKRPGSGSISYYLSVLEFNVVATDIIDRQKGGDYRNALSQPFYVFTHSSETSLLNPTAPKMFDEESNGIYSSVLLDWIEWEGPIESEAERSTRDDVLPLDDATPEEKCELA